MAQARYGFYTLVQSDSIKSKYLALATDVLIKEIANIRTSVIEMLAILLYLTLERHFSKITYSQIRPYGAGSANTNNLSLNKLEELGIINIIRKGQTNFVYEIRKEILERVLAIEPKVASLISNPDLKKLHENMEKHQKNESNFEHSYTPNNESKLKKVNESKEDVR